ncbi:MAG: amidohydrolase [Aquisalinus sp.]|nr:amidohydrolase [Aquisalinus sp.]
MRKSRMLMISFLGAGLFACGPTEKAQTYSSDLIIKGRIYTGREDFPIASEVIISDGFIRAVVPDPIIYDEADTYDEESLLALVTVSPDAEEIKLGEAIAFPGFTDAHAHLDGIGFRELTLNLEGTSSVEELKSRVAEEVGETTPGDVIYGRGWIETGWPEGRFPNRYDLDEAAPDNPVILGRADGHAAVVNSRAIELSGITDETPDPSGGAIERDENGVATGILIDNAENLVRGLIATPSPERRKEALQKGAEVYAAYGWTGVHSMSVNQADTELLIQLEEEGRLPIRVYNSLTPAGLDDLAETGFWEMNDGKLTTRAIKFYVDGALGSRGALLKEPYADQQKTRGLQLITKEQAVGAYRKALANDIQVTTHAIGDRGNTLVLDWYEEVLADHDGDPRWRIEHAQVIDPADIPRFAALGVIASMQPSHAIGDLHFAPARLGDERLRGAYAWRSLTDAGAVIAGGSDAPVERGDPMIEFYAAVGRTDLAGFQGANWHPEEALSRAEALAIFTKNPAYAAFMENRLGTIEVGKKADFTVLSADIMTIPVEQIPDVKAVMTIVDGKVVYDARKQ